ncbi:Hypothetical predicted protein [Octopus vulgaris]|uniref:SCAN domain-containing protein 3-like n=1 Tax=Octopus vulgaris TaxID=6645 RepID=A0AA36ALX9_OCTVU|nr:Hypothetical predicted protein [Octopus vulgaris]
MIWISYYKETEKLSLIVNQLSLPPFRNWRCLRLTFQVPSSSTTLFFERFQIGIAIHLRSSAVVCEDDIQEELTELQNDNDATMRYRHNDKGLWYHQSTLNSYPNLWKHLKLLLLAFITSYLVESGFNHVGILFSHNRIGLDVIQRGDLRLKLTSLKPDVSALAASH